MTEPEPIEEPTREAQLVADAQDFFEAGGVLSWGEWSAFDPIQKAAFQVAKQADRVDRLAELALALSGEEGLAQLAEPVDGGDATVGLALDRAMERVVEREMRRDGDTAHSAHLQRTANKAARQAVSK